MPSVGMRRTTRVFGVVKGGDSARVLRSGRRLWPEAEDIKIRRGDEGDVWLKKPEKHKSSPLSRAKQEKALVDDAKESDCGITESVKQKRRRILSGGDKFFGMVYSRKRKRIDVSSSSELLAGTVEIGGSHVSEMFGLQFSWQRKDPCKFAVVVKPSCGGSGLFSHLLFLVLRHVRKFKVSLKVLSAFLLSEPISGVYSSQGVLFLKGIPTVNTGICQFFGITQFMPLFSVDFSAVPLCFTYLHSEMLLKSILRSSTLVYNPLSVPSDVEEEIDFPESQTELQISCDSFEREPTEIGSVMPDIEIKDSLSLHASVKGPRLSGRNGKYRNINSKSKGTQRRRTSLRLKKARNASLVDRSNGALAYGLRSGQKRSIACAGSNKKLRSSLNSCTAVSSLEASSATVNSTEGLDSSHCSANILITESDRCHRVEGAVVTLERPASNNWLFEVKKDGLTRCTFKADKVMRPCSCNRYTHVIIFSLDNGWKLEFPNRRDWVVFKDLYKECSDHSIPTTVVKFIPVPGVHNVSDYADSSSVPFHRPDNYISANGDELSRSMTRKTAIYDLDSEDEGWLSKFNNDFQEHVSEDNFELIVDALEKAYFCNPDAFYDEKSVAIPCQDLGSKEVVEAVNIYWMRKRKQKRSSLLRVFQSYQAKRPPFIPQPVLRKRRSFKRQPSQFGRGKHSIAWQAIATEQDALEEKNALLKIKKAKASAKESKEFALQKRKRAQFLMENADLAIYKATMLVRIAEVAQGGESVDPFAECFLF
ncbi:hypothetical protein Lal_00021613 [Lupinus albus]|uniref:Enhancer of polycomb-like protein n=1 Tax=Lupinus albus TaxID=3870 RepID=A0A6A4NTC9_LUPAL|nr:putative enhancer of polycomb protein [Lupinus albus]KAF1860569.1 hypothetical protein Lal_00021613 [Lupinus albus]